MLAQLLVFACPDCHPLEGADTQKLWDLNREHNPLDGRGVSVTPTPAD